MSVNFVNFVNFPAPAAFVLSFCIANAFPAYEVHKVHKFTGRFWRFLAGFSGIFGSAARKMGDAGGLKRCICALLLTYMRLRPIFAMAGRPCGMGTCELCELALFEVHTMFTWKGWAK